MGTVTIPFFSLWQSPTSRGFQIEHSSSGFIRRSSTNGRLRPGRSGRAAMLSVPVPPTGQTPLDAYAVVREVETCRVGGGGAAAGAGADPV